MADESQFNPVALQLMRTPESSRRVLLDAQQGKQVPGPTNSNMFAIINAKHFLREALASDYRPSENTPFVPFANEQDYCDVIRVLYTVGDLQEIEIAQTEYLISIRVRPKHREERLEPPDRTKRVAKLLFASAGQKKFVQMGTLGKGVYGEVRPTEHAIGQEGEFKNFLNSMNWWVESDDVGFLGIKYPDGPTREVISPAAEDNLFWFRDEGD